MERTNVIISTDGACAKNHLPGLQQGGYAAVLRFGNFWCEIAGYEPKATNNRMEMMACIAGIEQLKRPCRITVRTDSQNLINCIAQLENRANNGWKTKTGAKVMNFDLHKKLYDLKVAGNHEIFYEYIKGHSGDPDNERCDELAKQAISKKEGLKRSGKD